MTDSVAAIARSVLYEGYVLWPYRRTALKNQRRWTFGGVYPRAYSEAGHADDPWLMRTECLVEIDDGAELDVSIRFLHVVDRRIERIEAGGAELVDSLTVAGTNHVAWQEAVEREIVVRTIRLRDVPDGDIVETPIDIDAGEARETLRDDDGRTAGVVIRRWDRIAGAVRVSVVDAANAVKRLRIDVTNESAWNGESRDATHSRACVSTHTVVRARGAGFVSLADPPAELIQAARECRNIGTWPVLIGAAPRRDTLLSSPIILPDYPEVARESGGDFFDGAEIDQLLMLSILSMTPDEQQWMREADPRTREILDRCLAASPDELRRLHGTTREVPIGGTP